MQASQKGATPLIDTTELPTHIARVAARLNAVGAEASADTFLSASYIIESLMKTMAISLCAGMRGSSAAAVYKFEYDLVRADGLGTWESIITACTSQSYGGYLDAELQPLITWLSQKRGRTEDQWARDVARSCGTILRSLGSGDGEIPSRLSVRHILSQMVQIRNKTKAHGAVGPDFFEVSNKPYIDTVRSLLDHCPVCHWEWFHLSVRQGNNTVKALSLRGLEPVHVPKAQAEVLRPVVDAVHFRTHNRGQMFHVGRLIVTNLEFRSFWLPNGGFSDNGHAEFLDYGDGSAKQVDASHYLNPPAPLPKSQTEGAPCLDIFSNVFGNLPVAPDGYVERPGLQGELFKRLRDRNHAIITLHGRGGIGKTSLALFAAHVLAQKDEPPFDYILWFSARDLELKPGGPSEVRRAVPNLNEVAKLCGELLAIGRTVEAFAELLQDARKVSGKGILMIFDNFETLDDPRGVHKFLDTHTHLPNKILITSRERAFKGDFPIEVGGMELEEAQKLLRQEAISLGVAPIITDEVVEEIHEYTDGHAYVMRVLLGEIAKDGRWVPLKSLVPRRTDLLNAVFERSFNRLTPAGRWVFLTVANWRSAVPELALLVVLGQRDLDVEVGLEECVRLSLIARRELADGQYCYVAPELAVLFGKKKLEGDPDRLLINEDLSLLREFGTVDASRAASIATDRIIESFTSRCLERAACLEGNAVQRVEETLARIAELWPRAWIALASFRQKAKLPDDGTAYALRRAVEELPFEKNAWIARAEHARSLCDDATRIASLVSAVEAAPKDIELIREVAYQLCVYIDQHKHEIPQARRGVYIASVRSHMEQSAKQLDPTGLSRLAWLFLLEGDSNNGWKYANEGLKKDSTNTHCLKIVERLEQQGYSP